MTCTSDRSGSASIGVVFTDQMPQATTNSVASRTRKRLATDQRISAAIISRSRVLSSFSTSNPSSVCRTPTRTRSPAFSPCASSGRASGNTMVMPGIDSDSNGPCASVASSPSMSSITASASCSGAAGAPFFGAAERRSSTPCRLASESIRNCPLATTCWPSASPVSTSVRSFAWRPSVTSAGR